MSNGTVFPLGGTSAVDWSIRFFNLVVSDMADSKTSFEKKLFFCVGEYAKYGFDQQG